MSKHDVVIALFTIIYGLMLTDLFLSVHRLIRSRRSVTWHWLPLLAAWYLFLTILKNWWDLAFIQYGEDWMNIYYFLAYGHLLVLVYLSVSTVLPDEVAAEGVDLETYYFEHHRYFWGLMGAVIFVSLAIATARRLQAAGAVNAAQIAGNGLFLLIVAALVWSRRRRVHAVLLSLLVLMIVLEILAKGPLL
jgi:hypothetical protein